MCMPTHLHRFAAHTEHKREVRARSTGNELQAEPDFASSLSLARIPCRSCSHTRGKFVATPLEQPVTGHSGVEIDGRRLITVGCLTLRLFGMNMARQRMMTIRKEIQRSESSCLVVSRLRPTAGTVINGDAVDERIELSRAVGL